MHKQRYVIRATTSLGLTTDPRKTGRARTARLLPVALTMMIGALVLLPSTATARFHCNNRAKCQITERTPSGFLMLLRVSGRDANGDLLRTLKLSCPQAASEGDGKSLGTSAPAKIGVGDQFKLSNRSRWHFDGTLDSPRHFEGAGRIEPGLCGNAPAQFTEPIPDHPVWTRCEQGSPVKGLLKGAALGTSIRIEYRQIAGPGPEPTAWSVSQSANEVVRHVQTNAAGKFTDTFSYPAGPPGTPPYTETVTARYPDDPSAQGTECSFQVEGPAGPPPPPPGP